MDRPLVSLAALVRLGAPLASVAAPALALAQSEPVRLAGSSDGSDFGRTLAAMGDVDGDGVPDLLVGAPSDSAGGAFAGRVALHSGHDGALLYELAGATSFRMFGSAVAGGADLSGDGIADFLVSAPLQSIGGPHRGRVTLHSGVDGAELNHFDGESILSFLGDAVAIADDLDGDGVGDVVASAATFNGTAGGGSGKLYAWSSSSGLLLWSREGSSAGESFGRAIASIGDLDGDLVDDLAVGAPQRSGGGAVELLSGATGLLLATWNGSGSGDEFGAALAFAGDVDANGGAALLVGVPGFDGSAGPASGRIELRDLASGALLLGFDGFEAGSALGRSVAAAGDVDGDGFVDFAAGAPESRDGRGATTGAFLLFDRAGALLHRRVGDADGDALGAACIATGDLDGDGRSELAFGAPLGSGGGNARGEVVIESATRLFLDSDLRAPQAGDTLTVTARHGIPGRLGLLAIVAIDSVPLFEVVLLAPFDALGELSADADIPAGLGVTIDVQAYGQGAVRGAFASGLLSIELP